VSFTLTPNLKLIVDDDLTSDAKANLNKIDALGSSTLVDNTGNLRLRSKQDISILPNSSDIGGSGSGGTVSIGENTNDVTLFDIFATTVSLNNANLLVEDGQLRFTDGTNYVAFEKPSSFSGDVTFRPPNADGTSGQVIQTDGSGNLSFVSVLTDSLLEDRIDIGNASNERTQVDTNAVGDIAADSTTGLTIKSGVIVDADINASAAITLSKLSAVTADRALVSNGSGYLSASSVTATELGYLSGVTSSIQTQIDSKQDELGNNATDWITADGTTKVITHNIGSLDVMIQVFDKADGAKIDIGDIFRTDVNTVTLTSSQAPGASGWRVLILEVS
jgi:hypothetical protein